MSTEKARPRTGTRKKIVFAAIPLSFVLALIYVGYAGYRSKIYYDDIKYAPQWDRPMVRQDDVLGYSFIPDRQGNMVVDGGSYPVFSCHDERGFRVPPEALETGTAKRPLILALGDSFTYGFGLDVTESFPHLVAEAVGGTAKNAGGNGYGLAQMLILARRHIPAMKPDYVIVQYSPWLTARAMYPFAPTTFSTLPVPYFSVDDMEFRMVPPVFGGMESRFPVSKYATSGEKSFGEFLGFFIRVGLPLRLHTDFNLLVYGVKRLAGVVPEPATSMFQVELKVYEEIHGLCEEHGCELVVVTIPNWMGLTGFTTEVIPAGVIGVLADRAMIEALPEMTSEAFLKKYAVHWGGHINAHHNAVANRIIADSVLEGIKAIEERKAGGVEGRARRPRVISPRGE